MFHLKNSFIFSIGSSQPREPALCQLDRHTFVPYVRMQEYQSRLATSTSNLLRLVHITSTELHWTVRSRTGLACEQSQVSLEIWNTHAENSCAVNESWQTRYYSCRIFWLPILSVTFPLSNSFWIYRRYKNKSIYLSIYLSINNQNRLTFVEVIARRISGTQRSLNGKHSLRWLEVRYRQLQ